MPVPVVAAQAVRCLSQVVPLDAIHAAVDKAGKRDKRLRDLPAPLVVQLVVCLGLIVDAASRQVLAHLLPAGSRLPTKKSVSRARYRVGPRPLMELFKALGRPVATARTCGAAFYRGLRIMALDATVLDVPDTPDNERVFGRRKTPRGRAAFPQAKVVALLEVGTHLIVDLLVRPHHRHELAAGLQLIGRSVGRDMLVLWDRGFYSFKMLQAILARPAHFVGRVPRHVILEPVRSRPDGSYLADIYPSVHARRIKRGGLRVRVIEYRVAADNGNAQGGETIRLVTSRINAKEAPALELARLYHERWEIELVYDEIKTHQMGRPNGQKVAIRAQAPPGVVQEIYGLALAHRVVRTLMAAAAAREGLDPDRLSFKNALVIVRRHLPRLAAAGLRRLPPLCSAFSAKSPGNNSRAAQSGATSAP